MFYYTHTKQPPKGDWKFQADQQMLSQMNNDAFLKNYLVDKGPTGKQKTIVDLPRFNNVVLNGNPYYIANDTQTDHSVKRAKIKTEDFLRLLELSDIDLLMRNHIINNLNQDGLAFVAGNYLGSKLVGCVIKRAMDQLNIDVDKESGIVKIQSFSMIAQIQDRLGSDDPEKPIIYKNSNSKEPLGRVDMEVVLQNKNGKIEAQISKF